MSDLNLEIEDRMLIEALRIHAKGGKRPEFPFDDLEFTLEMAADELQRLLRDSARRAAA